MVEAKVVVMLDISEMVANCLSGSTNSLFSESSSDHEEETAETLSQLTASLKVAQSRASSLSTNFARLMRLVVEEELDSVNREISQIKKGHYKSLGNQFNEAETTWETKKRIARARLIAAENEIDIRSDAMVGAEWSKFKVQIRHRVFLTLE